MATAPAYLRRMDRAQQTEFTKAEQRDGAFIDELIQIAEDRRTETVGPNYYDWAKEFFLFRPSFWQPQLEYQIKLRMPDLQMMLIEEASDLTDTEPVFFVSRNGSREKTREEALMANWRANNVQLEWFYAQLWSLLCHTGFLEVSVTPVVPRSVRCRARNPQNVYPDPFAPDWRDWEYVIVRVPMAPDEIARMFPAAQERLPGLLAEHQREMYLESRLGGVIGSGPMAIEMPPGAMQSVAIGRPPGATDFLAVDYCFIKDESRESLAKEVMGTKNAGSMLPAPESRPKYPTGRLIVRTGPLKLWDGPNQYRRFPIIPLFAMPPIYGVWGTPPVQYLIQQQHLAESMMSQVAENQIRTNYQYRVYQDGAILNPENLDKLGGSIRVKTAADVAQALRFMGPAQMGQEQYQFAQQLIAHMKQNFGYTPERQGQVGSGNISPGLLDAGVSNAMGSTRMRARLDADAVEHVGRLMFETMVDWLDDSIFTNSLNGDFLAAPWQGVPLDQLNGWKVDLDANSLKPWSSASLRQMVPVLAKLGLLPNADALKMLDVPNADDMAKRLEQQKQQEAMMAALAAAQKGKK